MKTYFGDNIEVIEAKDRAESSELIETSLHERAVALNEALEGIEDKNSNEAISVQEEIDDVKNNLTRFLKHLTSAPSNERLPRMRASPSRSQS